MSKRLILVRHGHRDKNGGRDFDSGLSEKGEAQAKLFKDTWTSKLKGKKTAVLSSPKKRCWETVDPLAQAIACPVRVSLLLDEQEGDEEPNRFKARIKRFLTWWKRQAPEFTVASSHGDWIPEFMELAVGKPKDLSKGEWVVLECDEGKVKVS